MELTKKILAIVPARAGSKGLPGKNIKPLLGKPLIAYTLQQAKEATLVDTVFVSTDGEEIAAVALNNGIDVPFLRPARLAADTSSSADVVEHVLDYFESRQQQFDYLLLLEPTSPLRKHDDIDNAIRLALGHPEADGVVSLGKVHMEHPMIVKKISPTGTIVPYLDATATITQRQQADVAYFPYGVVYLIKTSVFRERKSFYTENMLPYFIERWQNYEIDDSYDFLIVESILNKRREI